MIKMTNTNERLEQGNVQEKTGKTKKRYKLQDKLRVAAAVLVLAFGIGVAANVANAAIPNAGVDKYTDTASTKTTDTKAVQVKTVVDPTTGETKAVVVDTATGEERPATATEATQAAASGSGGAWIGDDGVIYADSPEEAAAAYRAAHPVWVVDSPAWDEYVIDSYWQPAIMGNGAAYVQFSDGARFYDKTEAGNYQVEQALKGNFLRYGTGRDKIIVTPEIPEQGHYVHHDEIGHWA
jgi:hypothetical protein